MTRDEFEEWIHENTDEAVDTMRDIERPLLLWLSHFYTNLKQAAIRDTPDDEEEIISSIDDEDDPEMHEESDDDEDES